MRRVRFNPNDHSGIDAEAWKRWSRRAQTATTSMRTWFDSIAAVNGPAAQPPFDADIWRDLKDLIMEVVFMGRCAFCEVDEQVNGFGDAEHYRPKKAVQALNDEGKWKPITVNGESHLGYGWLAYDWENLVPACSKCNTAKANRFPIEGVRANGPKPGLESTQELNVAERPLLLHPYFDEPRKHLTFGERGVIAGRTERGKATIDTFRLDRERLTSARDTQQTNAWIRVLYIAGQGRSLAEAVEEFRTRVDRGEENFSAAAMDFVLVKVAETVKELENSRKALELILEEAAAVR
jgi:hypothetical protein